MIVEIERVVAEPPDRPDIGGADHPMRKVTRQIAFEAGGWSDERAGKVAALFDSLAPEWTSRFRDERLDAVEDALARGGPFSGGHCLEVGSGTGLITAALAARFSSVIAVDLSLEMLVRAPAQPGCRVQADGGRLPVPDGRADCVALVNAFLFPHEVDRVLAPGGAIVWVSTIGDATPIYLPAADVDAALPGDWHGVAAAAGWGTWAVLRRPGL